MQNKIYHFILDPRVGGPHIYAKSVSQALMDHFDSTFITSGKGAMTDVALINLRHLWRPLFLFEVPLNVCLILCLAGLGRIVIKRSIFDVHGAANIAPIIAAWILRVPVVWHFHETVAGMRRFVSIGMFFISHLPHRLAVVTIKSADIFGLRNYKVLSGSVDLDYWKCGQGAGELQTDHACFNMVAVGNLNPLKGHDILLDALARCPGRWTLYIIGSKLANQTDFARKLEEKAALLQRQNSDCRIVFTGWQERAVIRDYLAKCDAFVLPSRSEACPMVLLEAMAMECTCVAADVGGVSDIVGYGAGYVVPPNDPDALCAALLAVRVMSLEQRAAMGAEARRIIMQGFSLESMASQHLELYSSLL